MSLTTNILSSTLLTGIAVLAAETGVAQALVRFHDPGLALLGHAAVVSFLVLWVAAPGRRSEPLSIFLALATALLGVFGSGMAVLATGTCALMKPKALTPGVWTETLFSAQHLHERERLRDSLSFDDDAPETAIQPYQDIFANGTVLQKQIAIAKMTRYFRPAFGPLLLAAARSPQAAVRVQAATALAKIERDFMLRYMRLEKEGRERPSRFRGRYRLAQIYDDYAYAGLIDEESQGLLRDKAIGIYESGAFLRGDRRILVQLARLYLRQNRPDEALRLLAPVATTSAATPSTAAWYMEALFRQERFADLHAFAASYAAGYGNRQTLKSFPECFELINLWAHKPTEREGTHAL